MDHLLASPLGMYQPYLIHTRSIKISTRFHQLSKTKLELSEGCITTSEVMEYGVAGIAKSLVCGGSLMRLVGQLLWWLRSGCMKFRAWTTSRWHAYSLRWSLLDMYRICVEFGHNTT
jgi:hypothetical protein